MTACIVLSGVLPPTSRSRSATTITQANNIAVSDISQTQWIAYCSAAGYTAHTHADHNATGSACFDPRRAIPFASNTRAAISYTAGTTAAENRLFSVKITNADARVYTPNTLNTPASSSGYSGGSQPSAPTSH